MLPGSSFDHLLHCQTGIYPAQHSFSAQPPKYYYQKSQQWSHPSFLVAVLMINNIIGVFQSCLGCLHELRAAEEWRHSRLCFQLFIYLFIAVVHCKIFKITDVIWNCNVGKKPPEATWAVNFPGIHQPLVIIPFWKGLKPKPNYINMK